MALTYAESATLMTDMGFRDRIKVACLRYANYIWEEPATTQAHATRIKWAQSTYANADNSANAVQPTVVMDPQVQEDGSAITDEALQVTVETSVNKMM
jgi:hypothetical protein